MSGHFQVRKKKLHNREFSLKSSCLHPVFGPSFTHYPLFEWGPQSKEILLNQGMKYWNSAFNAQVIIVVQAMDFFAGSFLNVTQFWTKLKVLVLCFPDFTENSNIFFFFLFVFIFYVGLFRWLGTSLQKYLPYTSKIWPNEWFKWTHATDYQNLLTRIKFYSDGSWPKGRTNKRMNEWSEHDLVKTMFTFFSFPNLALSVLHY
jgi:hypothetical protein